MQNSLLKPAYRDDLQILRAVAVIFVLLFHFKLDFLSGGYVGVDVFFVLSGYFIAQTLSQISSWKDAAAFYNRRLRRILPLAWFVFLVLMIAAPILFVPPELKTLNKDFIAAMFLIPNIVYWWDNNYFENMLFRPMLHYWSLGVEYQYYLLFPLVLWIMQRWKFTAFIFLRELFCYASWLRTCHLKRLFSGFRHAFGNFCWVISPFAWKSAV